MVVQDSYVMSAKRLFLSWDTQVLTSFSSSRKFRILPLSPEDTLKMAKSKIMDLFREKKELDYWDIFDELDLDLEIVVKTCYELEREGYIEVIPNK